MRFPGTPGISKSGTLKDVSGLPSKLAKGALTIRAKLKLSGKSGSSPPVGPKPCPVGELFGRVRVPLEALCKREINWGRLRVMGYKSGCALWGLGA